jgi:hypothetical protein
VELASHREGTVKQKPPIEFDREQFIRDRREMLLALDVRKMRAYAAKYGARVSSDDDMCLWAMHLARTVAPEIPVAERRVSRAWLSRHARPDNERN